MVKTGLRIVNRSFLENSWNRENSGGDNRRLVSRVCVVFKYRKWNREEFDCEGFFGGEGDEHNADDQKKSLTLIIFNSRRRRMINISTHSMGKWKRLASNSMAILGTITSDTHMSFPITSTIWPNRATKWSKSMRGRLCWKHSPPCPKFLRSGLTSYQRWCSLHWLLCWTDREDGFLHHMASLEGCALNRQDAWWSRSWRCRESALSLLTDW